MSTDASIEQRIDLLPLSLRADVRPGSVDAEARTVEVVFSTGAPVMRYDWASGERYVETLSMKPGDVNLERLNNGAPFLNSHDSYDLRSVLGVVVSGSAKVASGKGVASVRFSKRDDVEPIWQDIRDGIVRNVSVGYRVHKYEQTEGSQGKPTVRHAVDWEPYEISAVPMPADNGAKVRTDQSAATSPCVIVTRDVKETPTMEPNPLLDPKLPVVVPAAAAEPEPEPTETDAQLGARLERERIQGILDGCAAMRLRMEFAQELISSGVPLVVAQKRILDTAKKRQDQGGPQPGPSAATAVATIDTPSGVRFVGADPLENVWRGIENAMLAKVAPQYFKLEEIGRPYRSRSLLSFVELCLHHRHISTVSWDKSDLASWALGFGTRGSGFHSTSDFANILIDAINKMLRAAYEQAPQTFEPITRRMTISDFKTMNIVQFGEAPTLLEVKEGGEFQRGTMTDAKETMRLKTYGRVFAFTRQTLINDDLNALADVPVAFGKSARQKESDLVWAEITANGNMGDGVALFHSTHANLSATSNAIAVASLGAGFASMRLQKGVDGATLINLRPRYLIVPVGKETIARQFVTTIAGTDGSNLSPSQPSNTNPFAGMLQVITEPRLDANSTTAWYLSASAADTPVIGLAYLDGQNGPMVETRNGFDIDGIEIKCRHDVAAKVLDFRGLYKDPGA